MPLSDKQKNMLRAIAPGLEQGTIGDTFLFVRGDDRIQVGFVYPKEDDRSWRDAWNDLTEADLHVFSRDGFFIPIASDKYGASVQEIINAVKNDFNELRIVTALGQNDRSHPRIFLSYSHDDSRITEELAFFLGKSYRDVWYDQSPQGIRGGQAWWNEIRKQIANCDIFIFMLSSEALKSEWCSKEADEAKNLRKYIIPIKVRRQVADVPSWITDLQTIDMSGGRVEIDSLNFLYAALINADFQQENTTNTAPTQDRTYLLTDEAKRWAKFLVDLWKQGRLDQSFALLDVTAGNAKTVELAYGLGLLDETVDKIPPLGIFKELARVGLLDMSEEIGSRSRRWEINLTQELQIAVSRETGNSTMSNS